jgi:hypothetical protein
VKKTFTLVVLFFLSLGIAATSASACELVAPQYQLQSDTVEWQMSARFGETCRRGVRFKLISNPTIKQFRPRGASRSSQCAFTIVRNRGLT